MDKRAIGVFDSGLGGLTAVRRLHALMPQENIIYFGDTGRVPYGTKGRDIVTRYARQDVAFLRQFDLKAIVIACNTVSSVALDLLAAENNIPIIGTVEPACRRAMTMTQTGRVGVIATAATVRSGAYEKYLHKKDGTLDLFTQACPLFVPLVENGRIHRGDIVIETVVKEYLTPLKEANVDTLILGCTHYPLLEEVIGDFMGPDVTLIDSGAEAANLASTQFEPNDGQGTTQYFVSDDPQSFDQLAELFLQEQTEVNAELVDISRY
ncbi:glutamate racemase [Agathobaculum sp.]|uniref:glutamate racemase n=1 Tax=Agathobaculum sp. TaxID=2048138 RepID=UPI003FD85233